jgi:HlyD family secretion protein
VTAAVNEIDIGRIRVGQQAEVIPDAFAQRRFHGTVIRIAPEAKIVQNVTQFDVLVEVENPDGILASGMNCTVTILLTRKDDALIIPAEALQPLPPGTRGAVSERTVLLRSAEGFEERAVQTGMRSGTDVEVLSGLAEGDELKVIMSSRAFAENQMMQDRLREQRSFGGTGQGTQRMGQGGAGTTGRPGAAPGAGAPAGQGSPAGQGAQGGHGSQGSGQPQRGSRP